MECVGLVYVIYIERNINTFNHFWKYYRLLSPLFVTTFILFFINPILSNFYFYTITPIMNIVTILKIFENIKTGSKQEFFSFTLLF